MTFVAGLLGQPRLPISPTRVLILDRVTAGPCWSLA